MFGSKSFFGVACFSMTELVQLTQNVEQVRDIVVGTAVSIKSIEIVLLETKRARMRHTSKKISDVIFETGSTKFVTRLVGIRFVGFD